MVWVVGREGGTGGSYAFASRQHLTFRTSGPVRPIGPTRPDNFANGYGGHKNIFVRDGGCRKIFFAMAPPPDEKLRQNRLPAGGGRVKKFREGCGAQQIFFLRGQGVTKIFSRGAGGPRKIFCRVCPADSGIPGERTRGAVNRECGTKPQAVNTIPHKT